MILLGLFIICILLMVVLRSGRNYKELNKAFHGPTDWPIVGNAGLFFRKTHQGLHTTLRDLTLAYPNRCRLHFGPISVVFLYNPHDVEVLLASQEALNKASTYNVLKTYFGEGLVTADGENWKRKRKLYNPAFSYQKMDAFLESSVKNSKVLVRVLEDDVGNVFDIRDRIKMYTLDNIMESTFDHCFNIQLDPKSRDVSMVDFLCGVVGERMFKPWLQWDWYFNKTELGKKSNTTLLELQAILKKYLYDCKELKTSHCDGVQTRQKLLDILLQAQSNGQMTEQDILDELSTFLSAGYDTVSGTMSFAIYALAQHPLVQEKASEEQKEIFGNDDRVPTMRDLKEMKYLEQVIKETLRFYTITPFFGRRTSSTLTLPDGSRIPKNTDVLILLTALHRNPSYWKNPDVFDPDKFSPEAVARRNPYAYMPFGVSNRNCIGQKYAMMAMKAAISGMLRRYKIHASILPQDEVTLCSSFVLYSLNGINVRLEHRKS